jgi:pimeloyl-ACP methyl ester carboxylesterase
MASRAPDVIGLSIYRKRIPARSVKELTHRGHFRPDPQPPEAFTATGFTGGLNWYRAADHIWREKQSRPDEPVTVPTIFITGDRDPVQQITGAGSLDEMRDLVPGLTGVHVIPGAGHFVQMEAAGQVNRIMLEFLKGLPC